MHDLPIVEGLRARDPEAYVALYDAYADGLYDYGVCLLHDDAAAQQALRDAFRVAWACTDVLSGAVRLRPWMYALARAQYRRRGAGSPEHLAEPGDDLAELVGRVLAGLQPDEAEILELSVRHEICDADLAVVLGIPTEQAADLVRRARAWFEQALTAELAHRHGSIEHPLLAESVEAGEPPLTTLLRLLPTARPPAGLRDLVASDAVRPGGVTERSGPPAVGGARKFTGAPPDAATEPWARVEAQPGGPGADDAAAPGHLAAASHDTVPANAPAAPAAGAPRRTWRWRAVWPAVAAVVCAAAVAGGVIAAQGGTTTVHQSGVQSPAGPGLPDPGDVGPQTPPTAPQTTAVPTASASPSGGPTSGCAGAAGSTCPPGQAGSVGAGQAAPGVPPAIPTPRHTPRSPRPSTPSSGGTHGGGPPAPSSPGSPTPTTSGTPPDPSPSNTSVSPSPTSSSTGPAPVGGPQG